MSRAKRSALMGRVRQRGTAPERKLRAALRRLALRFRTNVRSLPGCPDIVLVGTRVAVFVDGDFWHGWRFPVWKDGLPPFWQAKIAANRARDRRNFQRMRRLGWSVVRVWEHELRRSEEKVVRRILDAVRGGCERKANPGRRSPRRLVRGSKARSGAR